MPSRDFWLIRPGCFPKWKHLPSGWTITKDKGRKGRWLYRTHAPPGPGRKSALHLHRFLDFFCACDAIEQFYRCL